MESESTFKPKQLGALKIFMVNWPTSLVFMTLAVTMMAVAIATVCLWHVSGYDKDMLKILPGT